MAFGQTVRVHRNAKGFGLNEFAERLGVSLKPWSLSRARAGKPATRRSLLRSRALGLPDLRGDIKAVVTLYRRNRDTARASNRS